MPKKPKQVTATVQGAVYTYEGEMVDRRLRIRLTAGPTREVVQELDTNDKGGYTVERIDAKQLYWVEIEGSAGAWSVGLPSAFRPEAGLNYRCFRMAPSEDTTARVTGKILTFNNNSLPENETQVIRWAQWPDNFWVTDEVETTYVDGDQTYTVWVPLGPTYYVYVNRGLAKPDTYCPPGEDNEGVDFRRESGTARTTTVDHASGDRMLWFEWTGSAYVNPSYHYAFEVKTPDIDDLVSLPPRTKYKAKIRDAGGVWKWAEGPRWQMPDRPGTGSDEKTWTKT